MYCREDVCDRNGMLVSGTRGAHTTALSSRVYNPIPAIYDVGDEIIGPYIRLKSAVVGEELPRWRRTYESDTVVS